MRLQLGIAITVDQCSLLAVGAIVGCKALVIRQDSQRTDGCNGQAGIQLYHKKHSKN